MYPTIAATGICFFSLWARVISRCFLTSFNSRFNCAIRSLIRRLSISNFFSPGPLVPIPPPSLDMERPRPVRRLSLYFNCASSTWIFPSLVVALAAKISRIISVRSMTFVSNICSKFLSCAGDNSSSQTIPVAPSSAIMSAISCTFPVPT